MEFVVIIIVVVVVVLGVAGFKKVDFEPNPSQN